ncbi:hypothetical protein [Bradyrhizobium sp. USDA 3315]
MSHGSEICGAIISRHRLGRIILDRKPETAQAWSAYSSIAIVAFDRGGGNGEATAKAQPRAVQVADRWHLMENVGAERLTAIACRCGLIADAHVGAQGASANQVARRSKSNRRAQSMGTNSTEM